MWKEHRVHLCGECDHSSQWDRPLCLVTWISHTWDMSYEKRRWMECAITLMKELEQRIHSRINVYVGKLHILHLRINIMRSLWNYWRCWILILCRLHFGVPELVSVIILLWKESRIHPSPTRTRTQEKKKRKSQIHRQNCPSRPAMRLWPEQRPKLTWANFS